MIVNVNVPPMPSPAPPGVIHNGKKADNFGEIDSSRGYPDVRSFKRNFGPLAGVVQVVTKFLDEVA